MTVFGLAFLQPIWNFEMAFSYLPSRIFKLKNLNSFVLTSLLLGSISFGQAFAMDPKDAERSNLANRLGRIENFLNDTAPRALARVENKLSQNQTTLQRLKKNNLKPSQELLADTAKLKRARLKIGSNIATARADQAAAKERLRQLGPPSKPSKDSKLPVPNSQQTPSEPKEKKKPRQRQNIYLSDLIASQPKPSANASAQGANRTPSSKPTEQYSTVAALDRARQRALPSTPTQSVGTGGNPRSTQLGPQQAATAPWNDAFGTIKGGNSSSAANTVAQGNLRVPRAPLNGDPLPGYQTPNASQPMATSGARISPRNQYEGAGAPLDSSSPRNNQTAGGRGRGSGAADPAQRGRANSQTASFINKTRGRGHNQFRGGRGKK